MSVVQMSVRGEPAAVVEEAGRRPGFASYSGLFVGLVVPVVLTAAWEIAVRLGLSNGRLVPPPSVIFATFAELGGTGELQRHILVTTSRVAAGFAIGVVSGTLLGAISGYSALTRRLFDPTLQALRAIPSISTKARPS